LSELDKFTAKGVKYGDIDNARFNAEDKLGRGKEMVDKLSELLPTIPRPDARF
jgi:type I restriction enzyme M protein